MKKTLPFVIGLTGSIGMGKTTVARFFAAKKIPVFCADKTVHALLKKGGAAVRPVLALFPEVRQGAALSRAKLSRLVFEKPEKLEKLESILHPLVWKQRDLFLKKAKAAKKTLVVYDIPLLFETGADKLCDAVICVYAKKSVREARVLARPKMTKEKLKAILRAQMPDHEKKSRADIVLRTDKPLAETQADVLKIIDFFKNEAKNHA